MARLVVEGEAIVVGGLAYGDDDRIVRLLTPTQGRIGVMARHARGSRRRFQGVLDLGNRLRVVAHKGRGELWALEEAALEDARLGARADHRSLALLAYVCEVTAALAAEEHGEPTLFHLLDHALGLLDSAEGPMSAAFRVGFETKALTFAGLAPSLVTCGVCEVPLEGSSRLRPDGAATHRQCGDVGVEVDTGWLAAVERARRTPLADLAQSALPPGPSWAFSAVVEYHAERGLKSKTFLVESEAG